MSRPSIAVVGGGVIGLSTALALADRGVCVTVFEPGDAGAQSSWAGAGILFPLLPWDYDDAVNRWCEAGIAAHPAWLQRLQRDSGIDPEHRASGMRIVGGAKGRALEWLANRRVAHQSLANGDLLLPEVTQVRNPRLIRALLASCQRAGVLVRERCPAAALTDDGERVTGVRLAEGELAFDAVVVAAGAWSARLARLAEDRVWPVRGQMLAVQAEPIAPTIVYEDGRYLVPRSDGVVLIGSTLETVGFDVGTTAEAKTALLNWATAVEPALAHAPLIRHWAGLRPGSVANHPLVGPHPDWPGLWLNCGHFRYGLTMAPACAHELAELLLAAHEHSYKS